MICAHCGVWCTLWSRRLKVETANLEDNNVNYVHRSWTNFDKKKDPFNLQLTQVRYPLLPLNIFTVYNRVTILPRFAFQTNQISLHPWTYSNFNGLILILINWIMYITVWIKMINSDLMYVYVLHTFTGLYFTQVAVYLAVYASWMGECMTGSLYRCSMHLFNY